MVARNENEWPKVKLLVIRGQDHGREFAVSLAHGKKTIGRGRSDIIINDPEVSSVHCSVAWLSGQVMVRDEGSTNGTYQNGIPVKSQSVLKNGDTINIGGTSIRMQLMERP
jgi:pSer/pThr/pTyr-binding forkhead associated (FHA) protein